MPRCARLLLGLGALACAAALPAPALAQAPQGPPGPPPGAGADLPAPPGTAPAFVPAGTPAAIPANVSGPGLLDGSAIAVDRKRRTATFALACQARGDVRLSAPALGKKTAASGAYRCASGRARVRLTFTAAAVKRLPKRTALAATAAVKQSGRTTRISLLLNGGTAPAPGFWTDGYLHCAADAPAGAAQAYLAEPDFTTRTLTPVSTRGWVAWYSPRAGWHWLGSDGEGKGRWNSWLATSTGITQFHPGGAAVPVPYTRGPVSFPAGEGISAVGVFEIVYWTGGKPVHQWRYVNAGTTGAAAAGGGTQYCTYA